jgi:WD40 repeat protein
MTSKISARVTGHQGVAYCVRWSPDGSMLASSGHTTVRLWNFRTMEPIVVCHGHTGYVERVAWRPSGELVASVSADKIVRLWGAPGGERVAMLGGHTDWVHGVTWSPDSSTLATCGGKDDGTIRLWEPL